MFSRIFCPGSKENRSIDRPTPQIPATIGSTLPRFQPLPKKGVLSSTERFAYPRSSNFLIPRTFINHIARLATHPPQRSENIKLIRKGISQWRPALCRAPQRALTRACILINHLIVPADSAPSVYHRHRENDRLLFGNSRSSNGRKLHRDGLLWRKRV